MTHSMIGFLTNEPMPKRLQTAIDTLKQQHAGKQPRDGKLLFLGSCMVASVIGLIVLLLYAMVNFN